MTIDITPPAAVVEFVQQNGYDTVQKDEILSNKTKDIYRVYSNKNIFYINNDKINVFESVYVILQNGEIKFADEQEVLKFLNEY